MENIPGQGSLNQSRWRGYPSRTRPKWGFEAFYHFRHPTQVLYVSDNRYITSWECCLVARIKKQNTHILSTSCSLLSIRWGRENPLIFVFSFANSFRYPNLPVKISVSYIVTPIWWGRRSEAELGTWMGRRVTSSKRCYNAGNTELRR